MQILSQIIFIENASEEDDVFRYLVTPAIFGSLYDPV